ncbi:MAG: hypothetical protein R3A11_04370 [Bdellovibrionota bacterium]
MKFVCNKCSSIIEVKNEYLPEEASHIQCPKCNAIFLFEPEDESVRPVGDHVDPFDLISKSTLIDQGPIRSQPEELLFRPEIHSQYDFDLMKETLALPSKLKKKPWLGGDLPWPRRIAQNLVTCLVLFSGFVLGLKVLGIRTDPQGLNLLVRNGFYGQTQGVTLLEYQGQVQQHLDRDDTFHVQGVMKNFDSFLSQEPIRCSIRYFDAHDQPLQSNEFLCRKTSLQAGQEQDFESDLSDPPAEFAFYRVDILKP